MSKSPAFQFYPTDYLADGNVALMSLEQEGAYIRLLCFCWNEGSIPDDIESLARYCRVDSQAMERLWNGIKNCFKPVKNSPNKLMHPRLEEEKRKQKKRKQQQRDNAKSRWAKGKPDDATALPNECQSVMPSQCSSSSSPSSASQVKTPLPPKGESEAFKKFWAVYPNRKAKDKAISSWNKQQLDSKADQIISAVEKYRKTESWLKENGMYIPLPATFLNGKRWEDEITPALPAPPAKLSHEEIIREAITQGLTLREKAKTWVVYSSGQLVISDRPDYAIIKAEGKMISLRLLEVVKNSS